METLGRKFVLTAVCIAISSAAMLGGFVLALAGKLTGEFVTLCTVFFPVLAAATVGFQWSNAKVSAAWAGAKGDVAVAVAESPQPSAAAAASVRAGPSGQNGG